MLNNLFMKRLVLLTVFAAYCSITHYAQAQSLEFSTFIIATDTITDEGVTFAASSDDAEQVRPKIRIS